MTISNVKRSLRLRPALVAAAASIVVLATSGCGSMQSMLGLDDSYVDHDRAPLASSGRGVPITTTSSDELQEPHRPETDANTPAESSELLANRAVSIDATGGLSAEQFAYSTTGADAQVEISSPLEMPTPKDINQFGEFDGKPRPSDNGAPQMSVQQHTFVTEGFDSDVSIDPSGRWIAFTSTRHSQHPQIYLQRVDGTSVVQLTSDNADYAFPSFSSDGKLLAFASTRGGDWDIYVMDTDGRNVVQITSGPAQDLHPSFSPDGKRLVYCSMGARSNQWELWTANVQNSEKRMIGYGLFPSWSPGKQKDQIAFQRARQRGSRWFSLWTLDLVDGEACRMTEVAASANAAIVSPSWSPDGQHIAFATIVDPAMMSAKGKPEGPTDIWTVSVDGSNRRRLTDGAAAAAKPCWSSDNRVYFVSNRGGSECVWSAQAERPSTPAMATTDSHEAESKH